MKMRLPSCTGFGITGSGIVMPLVEENLSGFVDTYRMSSYFSSAQNLVTSFQHTGALARNSLYAGYGSPAKKSGECRGTVVRSAALPRCGSHQTYLINLSDPHCVYSIAMGLSTLSDSVVYQLSWTRTIDAASPTGVHHVLIH